MLEQNELYFDKYKREICFIKDESQCNPEDVKKDMALRKISIEIELFLEEKENWNNVICGGAGMPKKKKYREKV